MRQAMGVAVFAGMIGVTLFGLFLTPVFYVNLVKLGWRKKVEEPSTEKRGLARGTLAGTAAVLILATAPNAQSSFNPSRSANSRTETISTLEKDFSCSSSLSPVTRNLQPYATAAARIGWSLESRRTNTGEVEDLLFGVSRSVLHQFVGATPKVPQPVLLQPLVNLLPFFSRQHFEFFNDFGRAHEGNIAGGVAEWKATLGKKIT
jgi:hypothetical protein